MPKSRPTTQEVAAPVGKLHGRLVVGGLRSEVESKRKPHVRQVTGRAGGGGYHYDGISELRYGAGCWTFLYGLPDIAAPQREYARWKADGHVAAQGTSIRTRTVLPGSRALGRKA